MIRVTAQWLEPRFNAVLQLLATAEAWRYLCNCCVHCLYVVGQRENLGENPPPHVGHMLHKICKICSHSAFVLDFSNDSRLRTRLTGILMRISLWFFFLMIPFEKLFLCVTLSVQATLSLFRPLQINYFNYVLNIGFIVYEFVTHISQWN